MSDLSDLLGELRGLGDELGVVKDDVIASVKTAGVDVLGFAETVGDGAKEEDDVMEASDSDNPGA